jgi:HAD superfamily hydrolase (TIGR01509 family)
MLAGVSASASCGSDPLSVVEQLQEDRGENRGREAGPAGIAIIPTISRSGAGGDTRSTEKHSLLHGTESPLFALVVSVTATQGGNVTKAVLLDIDGTLIDSNDAHARAWVEAAGEFGHVVEFGEVRRLIGMGGDKVLPRLTGLEEESREGERLLERRGEIFRSTYLPELRAFPGARELVERMRADGKRLVVATSASETDLKALLEQVSLEWLLEDATNSDDAEESKPAPDIVEAALEQSGEAAADVVMIGDTPYDVEAARRAGVRIIGVECGGWSADELAGAVEVYADPAALLRDYDQSVLGG